MKPLEPLGNIDPAKSTKMIGSEKIIPIRETKMSETSTIPQMIPIAPPALPYENRFQGWFPLPDTDAVVNHVAMFLWNHEITPRSWQVETVSGAAGSVTPDRVSAQGRSLWRPRRRARRTRCVPNGRRSRPAHT